MQSQLEQTDQQLMAESYNKTDLGKVIKITDEEEDDLPELEGEDKVEEDVDEDGEMDEVD